MIEYRAGSGDVGKDAQSRPQVPVPAFAVASIKPQPWTNEGSVGVVVHGNTLTAEQNSAAEDVALRDKNHEWIAPMAFLFSVFDRTESKNESVNRETERNNSPVFLVPISMMRDLRYALRMIASHRWFSAAVIVTLAVGIGLNTMVFTLVNAVLFKPLSFPGGERLVVINSQQRSSPDNQYGVSYPDYRDFRASASAFEAIEASMEQEGVLSERDHPAQSYNLGLITPGMFQMLRTPPILGRPFTTTDGAAGAEAVVLLGYGVWKDRYASASDVIGRVVRVDEKPATIVGVMPPGFKFPRNQDLWMPLIPAAALESRGNRPLQLFAYLKPGVSISQGSANLRDIANRLSAAYPEVNKDTTAFVQTFHNRYNGGPIKRMFLAMLAAVGFVLLIACANVANMMLSRALVRRREISIRVAVGASRWQIVRQLLLESLLLGCLGGLLGIGLSLAGVHAFDVATQDVGKPYWILFRMDWDAFAYCAAICVVSGILFGLVPALQSTRVDLNNSLKDGVRSAGSHRGGYLSAVLVVSQFALTLVLLAGAGLFVRSFFDNLSLNPEVPTRQILSAHFHLPDSRYPDADARTRFLNRLLTQLRVLPGVTEAAIVSNPPQMGARGRDIEIEGRPAADPKHRPAGAFLIQLPGYFQAVNLPLQEGRDFTDHDGSKGREDAIVSRDFAEKFWPRQPAIGKRFRTYSDGKPGPWLSIVGVATNMVQETQEASPRPLAFLPERQEGASGMWLLVRSKGDPLSMTAAVRATLQALDQDLPLSDVRSLAGAIEHDRWFLVVFGTLFSVFGFIGLLLASVGIYAVIAQATGNRTQEIGVRMALGATSGNILRLILRRGMRQLAMGLGFGLIAAIPAVNVLAKVGMRISPTDPLLFIVIVALLTAVGVFACWLPARRAAALDPINAIRYE
jgi:putative ABC transport system permease protein